MSYPLSEFKAKYSRNNQAATFVFEIVVKLVYGIWYTIRIVSSRTIYNWSF